MNRLKKKLVGLVKEEDGVEIIELVVIAAVLIGVILAVAKIIVPALTNKADSIATDIENA